MIPSSPANWNALCDKSCYSSKEQAAVESFRRHEADDAYHMHRIVRRLDHSNSSNEQHQPARVADSSSELPERYAPADTYHLSGILFRFVLVALIFKHTYFNVKNTHTESIFKGHGKHKVVSSVVPGEGSDAKQNRCRRKCNLRAACAKGQSSSDGAVRVTASLRTVAQTARVEPYPPTNVCLRFLGERVLRKTSFFSPLVPRHFYNTTPQTHTTTSAIDTHLAMTSEALSSGHRSDNESVVGPPKVHRNTKQPTNYESKNETKYGSSNKCLVALLFVFFGVMQGFCPCRDGSNSKTNKTLVQEAKGIIIDDRRRHSHPLSHLSLSSSDTGLAEVR